MSDADNFATLSPVYAAGVAAERKRNVAFLRACAENELVKDDEDSVVAAGVLHLAASFIEGMLSRKDHR